MLSFTPTALKALELHSNRSDSLVSSKLDISTLAWRWQGSDKSFAVCVDGTGDKVQLRFLGQVDFESSKAQEYGTLFAPQDGAVTASMLRKSKYSFSITLPDPSEDAQLQARRATLVKQWINLEALKDSVLSFCSNEHLPDVQKVNSWSRILQLEDNSVRGWITVSVGPVYAPLKQASSAEALLSASPIRGSQGPDLRNNGLYVADPKGYVAGLDKKDALSFKPNSTLALYDADGSKVTSDAIRTTFYTGRWVEVIAQPVLWNVKDGKDPSRTLQLQAVKISALAEDTPANPSIMFYKDGNGEMQRAVGSDGRDDPSTSTLSRSAPVPAAGLSAPTTPKRAHDGSGPTGSPSKKAATTSSSSPALSASSASS